MDKFRKRIEQAKDSASLLHQVFNELEQQIADKLVEGNKDLGKTVELRFLWNHCGHPDYAIAFEACQSVTNMTLKGQLGINESITALISNVSTARHYGLLTDSISQLMLRGSYQGNRHPFISLYEMQPDSWPYILQQTSSIISSGKFEVQALKDIKPFVIYILCYGLYETQISLLCLLMGKLHSEENSIQLLTDWLLEALLWQNIQNSEKHTTNFYLICVQHLCEYAIAQQNEELGREVAIHLTAAMQASHKKFGFGTHHCIYLLKQLNNKFTLYLDPIVVMISQFLLECQANCYEPILDLCLNLISKPCNTYIWAMLQCAVLSIFPYSTKIEPDVVKIVESPCLGLNALEDMKSKDRFRRLLRSESSIQAAIATAELAQHLEQHPEKLSLENRIEKCSTPSPTAIFLFKCAKFWRSNDLAALDDAVNYVSSTKLHANPLLTLLLKKLTAPSNGPTKLAILYHLPALAIDKTCVPRVLQIYEALSSSQQLKPLRVRLLTELWKIEDRVFPNLEKAMNKEQLQTEEFHIAKALAIHVICDNRSDKYGAELLSIISDLLNSSLGKLNTISSATIATLSLRSLVSLCRAEVVDLKSVWDLLAPKLNQDHRGSVVSEMCNLLGLTAELRIDNEEYDEFIHQAITTLFRVSLTSANASEVRCLALKSLCRFPKKDFILKCMPEVSKDDLKIPVKYLPPGGKTEIAVKAEDVLDFVPGLCWMKLLDFYDGHLLLPGFVPLLSHLIQKEIETMPIWIYRKAATDVTKKNEPNNYSSFLKEDSVLAALILYIQRICENNPANRLRMSVAFKILAGPFERPLPPLNWTILLPIAQQYELEPEFMEIIFSQTPHSFSAQSIVENILSSEPLNGKLAVVALSYLGPICKVVSLKLIQEFLYRLLNKQQSEILMILTRLHHSLSATDPPVPPEVKETISDILVAIFPILPDDLESAKRFASCFRLVSGPHHPLCEPSNSTAKKYIVTLLYASQESQSKTALDYVLKALQLTLYLHRLDDEVTKLIHQSIDANCKSSPNFLLQFLSFIQLTAMRTLENEQNFSSLMDTLALIVGVLSNSLVFYSYPGNKDNSENDLIESIWEYFSLGTSRLVSQPQWIAIKKNMQDWILTMLEKEVANVELRRRLLDALPSMGGVEKDAYFRIMMSI